jgi:hypothetical protein
MRQHSSRIIEAALPTIERKYALVIGINKYVDRRIPELQSAVNDAEGVARALEQRFGYEAEVLPDATRESLLRALNRLAIEARPGDSVVIYFAGHGVLLDDKQQGFWLPADAHAEKPESWLSNADINRLVGLISSRQLLHTEVGASTSAGNTSSTSDRLSNAVSVDTVFPPPIGIHNAERRTLYRCAIASF